MRSALRLDQVHIYGHSYGAMLALEYLANDPTGVVSLVLSSPVITPASYAAGARALLETMPDSTRDIILRHEEAGTTSSQEYQAAYRSYMLRVRAGHGTSVSTGDGQHFGGTQFHHV